MKKIITLFVLTTSLFTFGQAFKGKGDVTGQLGANIQKGGSSIHVSSDFGISENMSYGFGATYLLNVSEGTLKDVKFSDKFDLKARFNANIGNVVNIDPMFDVYPGLDLGLKNFGAHLGARYFFTDGFGVYSEIGAPIATYKTYDVDSNNQFYFNIGASFHL